MTFFNARAENGDNYRVLADVSGLSGAPIGPGGRTTGKLYFDVVGATPNSVVFNNRRRHPRRGHPARRLAVEPV